MPRNKPPTIARSIQIKAISNTTPSETIDKVIGCPALSVPNLPIALTE